jgi:hypothetical protein
MARRQDLSLAEAVDYLETVVALDETPDTQPKLLRDPARAQERAKQALEKVTSHLRRYCAIHDVELGSRTHLEGIRSLVDLAGKAARKLDRLTTLFHATQAGRLTQGKQVSELEDLVRTVVGPETVRQEETRALWEEEHVDEWAPGTVEEAYQIKTADQLRADTEYELLQLRDEEGNRYFGPELLRSIRASCRLTDYLSFEPGTEDPLIKVHLWFDKNIQVAAQAIYQGAEPLLKSYFRQAGRARGQLLVSQINQAAMALMLARSPYNLLRNCAAKSCTEYFYDFHTLLRQALLSEPYLEILTGEPNPWQQLQIDLVHQLCLGLYDHVEGTSEMNGHLRRIFGSPAGAEGLSKDYETLAALLHRVPNGPLFKALDLLQEMDLRHAPFDPIRQKAVPCRTAQIEWEGHSTALLRMPAPVIQEWIHRPNIAPEFSGFLRAYAAQGKHHLLINLQSRAAWQERSRSESLEALQRAGEVAETLTVITLPRDNDFYHQVGAFHELHTTEAFFQAFLEQLGSTETGYHFPVSVSQTLSPHYWEELLSQVRRDYYNDRRTLTRHQRLDCIDLVQQLAIIRLITALKPTSISFTDKDGVDLATTAQVEMIALLHALQGKQPSGDMVEWIRLQLFGYPLLVREREVNPERFKRCISLLQSLSPENLKAFGIPHFAVQLPEEPSISHQ